jgi:hypothetical protein
MNDTDIRPADLFIHKRRQTGHFIAAGGDVTGIYTAAERIGAPWRLWRAPQWVA